MNMNFNNLIDVTAEIAKLAIENSDKSTINKEFAKIGVDGIREFLKSVHPYQQMSNIVGLSLTNIQEIKFCAEKCGLDRVVHFPMQLQNGSFTCLMRMYGGDIQQFASCLGMSLIHPTSDGENDRVNFWEKNFGVIIYQREN